LQEARWLSEELYDLRRDLGLCEHREQMWTVEPADRTCARVARLEAIISGEDLGRLLGMWRDRSQGFRVEARPKSCIDRPIAADTSESGPCTRRCCW
jgi:hypothetical protein